MATIRKRGNTYQIRVSAGYDTTGKQIVKTKSYKPLPTMTQRQIQKELNKQAVQFENNVLQGQYLDGNITFSDFIDRWLSDYAQKHLKAKTLDGYMQLLPRIKTALGHIKVQKIQPTHLLQFYNNLAETGIINDIKYIPCAEFKSIVKQKGFTQKALSELSGLSLTTLKICYGGGTVAKATADTLTAVLGIDNIFTPTNANKPLSDSTIAKYHRIISSILTSAVQWQVIPSNPCQRVKPPHNSQNEIMVLDEAETQTLIKCLNTAPLQLKTVVMLILYTGLRRGEVCGLDWSDIDFDNKQMFVNKTLNYTPTKGIYEDTPKTKTSKRVIQIPNDMLTLLKEHKTEQLKQRLLCGDMWTVTDKVFTSDTGGYIRPDTLSNTFKKFIKANNLPNIHLHTLRHISATLLIANGVDVVTVSNRLGHANKSTTLNIYSHAIKSADEKAAETLRGIFTSAI